MTEKLQHRDIHNWYPFENIPDDMWEFWYLMEMDKQWELIDTDTGEILWVGSQPNGFVSTNFPEAKNGKDHTRRR